MKGKIDHLKLASEEVERWDIAYVKICSKVQLGIPFELFNNNIYEVAALDENKGHFPPFEDYYWPTKPR